MIDLWLPMILQPWRCSSLQRLGKDHDGGYLVNVEDVSCSRKLISLGIGPDHSFEQDFAALALCPVDAWDPEAAVSTDFWQGDHRLFVDRIGEGGRSITEILGEDRAVFLKIDIEGNEWALLDDLISISPRLTGLVIELHGIQERSTKLMDFISKIDLRMIHLHVNNYFYNFEADEQGRKTKVYPQIIELTFSSAPDLIIDRGLVLPHSLDQINDPQGEDFRIRFV